MRILVHEHLTGGGLLDQPQLGGLAHEGDLMVRALLRDLAEIPGLQVAVTRDHRLDGGLPARVIAMRPGGADATWARAVDEADAVWPIAPETGGILLGIVRGVLARGRRCLASAPEAIAVAASKRATAFALAAAGLPAAPVYATLGEVPERGAVVAKPDDGAGCQETRLFEDRAALGAWLNGHAREGMVFQPFVQGEACSLSALFCAGRARPLSGNRQRIALVGGQLRFDGTQVGALEDAGGHHARIAREVARAMPGLWGYCGIDFIETPDGPVIIEVNPRLTTSYAGLREAIGENPARLVLGLPDPLETAVPLAHGQ